MIKFFRKIRQKLLSENKLGKYLIYAAGEIILVVVGILIALQINNLNEAKKNEYMEQQYLKRLKAEFESTLQESNSAYRFSNEYIRLSELLLKVISSDTMVDMATLVFAIETAHYGTPPAINQNVWQDITNSGNSAVIKNADLRFIISDYYKEIGRHWKWYDALWVSAKKGSESIKSTILPWQDRDLVFSSFNYLLKGLEEANLEFSSDYKTIVKKLRITPLLESTTMTVLTAQRVSNLLMKNEILTIQEIIAAIDLELERWK